MDWKIFMPLLLIAGILLNYTGNVLILAVTLICGLTLVIFSELSFMSLGGTIAFEVIIAITVTALGMWLNMSYKNIVSKFCVFLLFLTVMFLLSSIMYYAQLTESIYGTWYYWVLVVIGIVCIVTPLSDYVCILLSSFGGGFMVSTAISYYTFNSNLYFIPINFYRYATVDDFSYAVTKPPFQWRGILYCL